MYLVELFDWLAGGNATEEEETLLVEGEDAAVRPDKEHNEDKDEEREHHDEEDEDREHHEEEDEDKEDDTVVCKEQQEARVGERGLHTDPTRGGAALQL